MPSRCSFPGHWSVQHSRQSCTTTVALRVNRFRWVSVQSILQEAITLCSCKEAQDPYGLQHFYLARMKEGRRISKQNPQTAVAEVMANVLVCLPACHPSHMTVPNNCMRTCIGAQLLRCRLLMVDVMTLLMAVSSGDDAHAGDDVLMVLTVI